jgi:hypothetical protein
MKPHKVIVQPEAQAEVNAIRIHQNSIDTKRGQRFIEAFDACLEQLKANPSFQERKGTYRHIMLHKVPLVCKDTHQRFRVAWPLGFLGL